MEVGRIGEELVHVDVSGIKVTSSVNVYGPILKWYRKPLFVESGVIHN